MTPLVIQIIAIILTIMVLSRIAGDNPFFRAAQYLFVGVSLGLAFVVVYHQVLRPMVLSLMGGGVGEVILYGVPLIAGVLLLPRILGSQSISWLANIPLALIFGVGAALAMGGAIIGTLLPQILDTARPISGDTAQLVGSITLVIGTIITLTMFYYTAPRETRSGRLIAGAAVIGHWLLMITFGVFLAGALQSYLSALLERLSFVIGTLRGLIGL